MTADDASAVAAEHRPAMIRLRLRAARSSSYLGDAVLGGMDGCVTTFSVVAGAAGGGFPSLVIVVLGVANLVADGVSMAVGNYLGVKVARDELENARREEQRHIDIVPQGERDEIREIYARKGFEGELLDRIVEVVTKDRGVWIDTMLKEELRLQVEPRSPWMSALATLSAFVAVGLVPLLPYLAPILPPQSAFPASALFTGVGFAAIGAAKGVVLHRRIPTSVVETVLTGGAAATLAYGVGYALRHAVGG